MRAVQYLPPSIPVFPSLGEGWASQVALEVKNQPAKAGGVRAAGAIPGSTPCSALAWRIPWTESLVGYSPQCRKESDTIEAT